MRKNGFRAGNPRTLGGRPAPVLLAVALIAAAVSIDQRSWSASAGSAKPATDAEVSNLHDSFRVPPDDSKLMVRWWWFGPAVTTAELDRELPFKLDSTGTLTVSVPIKLNDLILLERQGAKP